MHHLFQDPNFRDAPDVTTAGDVLFVYDYLGSH